MVTVVAEISLTLGVLTGFFIWWQFGLSDPLHAQDQTRAARSLSQEWAETSMKPPPLPKPSSSEVTVEVLPSTDEPPVVTALGSGQAFALLHVPRFGDGYVRSIGEGVELHEVLNNPRLGVGRYPESNQLGELGNFALAGHRTTFGASFSQIGELRLGDRIYVEVDEGWFSYAFRNLEYVWPSDVDVLNPVPQSDEEVGQHRIITLTSCHPERSEAERIIAYGVFDGWYPRSSGPPPELSYLVEEE